MVDSGWMRADRISWFMPACENLFRFVRAQRLGFGFAAAMAPLATLLGLQVVWLTDLDRASTLAHRAAIRNGLEAVGTEVGHFYRSTSERLLNVPAALFATKDLNRVAAYWKARCHDGVRRLFAVDYGRSPTGRFFTYDAKAKRMVSTYASDEALAIVVAALPWQRWVHPGALDTDASELQVNEQDPEHRIVLKPVVGEGGRVIGLVGLVIDIDYVRDVLLPRIIRATSTVQASNHGYLLEIFVNDTKNRSILGADSQNKKSMHRVLLHPSFVLRDWTIGAISNGPSTHWFRGSLAYNLTLGFVLAVALVVGIVLALLGARDAMRLSQMKSDFVSNVSHELRTPLASIRLFAELMKRGRVRSEDKVIEYGKYIEAESRRLSRLIDNILDFSHIESKQKLYRCTPTHVLDVIEPVLDAFATHVAQSGVRIVRDFPERPGPRAQLDRDAVCQALHNLLDNAAKYSKGADEIKIRIHSEDCCVVISVEDRGVGIAKEDQARVFERFHRVGNGLVHDVKGSGLGLAIVKHTVSAHNGRVTLQSEPGVGSTFSLWFPECGEINYVENTCDRG